MEQNCRTDRDPPRVVESIEEKGEEEEEEEEVEEDKTEKNEMGWACGAYG